MNAINMAGDSPADKVSFSIITSHKPDVLSKQFRFSEGLVKVPGGDMIKGEVSISTVTTPEDFCEVLKGLKTSQALSASLPTSDNKQIITNKEWLALGKPAGVISRTKEHFQLRSGVAGLLTLDCDDAGYGLQSLAAILNDVCPEIATATAVGWASASSFLYRNNAELRGATGWRIWLFIKDAGDVERAGTVLFKRLWLAGLGRILISKAGLMLLRSVFDAAMWQPARLDFAAGAICHDGIEQQRGNPEILNSGGLLDSAAALPDLTMEQQDAFEKCVAEAKAAHQIEADTVRHAYLAAHGKVIHARMIKVFPDATEEEAIEVVALALKGELVGEFPIKLEDGRVVSVREVLDDPGAFNKVQTCDPLEPDYQGGKITGILYLHGSQPVLHSQAHGGQTFRLYRQRLVVVVKTGEEYRTARETSAALAGRVWKCGGRVGIVANGAFQPLPEVALNHVIAGACRFVERKPIMRNGVPVAWSDLSRNVPRDVAKTICQFPGGDLVCEIEGVRSAPLMNLDGEVTETPGYDPVSGWFLDFDEDEWPRVPLQPSDDQVKEAVGRIYGPISQFPYVSDDDRGVALALMLTSVFRPMLDRAPGGGIDANLQGTGKSKLAQCIGIVGAGEAGYRMIPYSMGMKDDEMGKQIATVVKSGTAVCSLDNVMGEFNSGALASFLAPESAKFSDRALHTQDFIVGSHRVLFLVTGNNLSLRGELPRRFIICRLDAGVESPITRQFQFEPVAMVKSSRMRLIADIFTIYRGWIAADRPTMVKGTVGSYESWSATIRQCTIWAGQFLDGVKVGDPAASLLANTMADPAREEEHELLLLIMEKFGETVPFTAKKLVEYCISRSYEPLAQALKELMPRGITTRSVGSVLKNRRDRLTKGLILRKSENRDGSGDWMVSNQRH